MIAGRPIAYIRLFRKPEDTYYVIGLLGILFLGQLLLPLCYWTRYRYTDVLFLLGIGLAACYAFNVVRAFLNVREAYSYYHYYLLVALAAGAAGYVAGKDLLALGDLFALSMAFVCCVGRLGCFHSGCCFGQPMKRKPWKLFPTQLTESLLCFGCFAAGLLLIACETAVGNVFVLLTAAYAFGRYLLEFRRADVRNHFLSVSEAQWTGTLITAFLLFVPVTDRAYLFPVLVVLLTIECAGIVRQLFRRTKTRSLSVDESG